MAAQGGVGHGGSLLSAPYVVLPWAAQAFRNATDLSDTAQSEDAISFRVSLPGFGTAGNRLWSAQRVASVSVLLKENLLRGRQRKEQRARLTGQNTKSKALVKGNGLIVLGVHQKRESGGVRP